MKLFDKITIIGTGLIGGSIGLDARKKRLAREVVGVCRRGSTLKKAVKKKVADRVTLSLEEGVKDADLVILAIPVDGIARLAKEAIPHMKKGAILTDVGSSKSEIVRKIEKMAGGKISFVGSHPMAGSEKSGPENARPGIFMNAPLLLAKTKNTKAGAVRLLSEFWRRLGSRVFVISPEEHDKIMSFTSFLPHAAAYALSASQTKKTLRFAAGGLKDTTRVASSDPENWAGIFLSSGKPLIRALAEFKKNLGRIEKAVRKRDAGALLNLLGRAKKLRDSIGNG